MTRVTATDNNCLLALAIGFRPYEFGRVAKNITFEIVDPCYGGRKVLLAGVSSGLDDKTWM
jgi:hypothetical protein